MEFRYDIRDLKFIIQEWLPTEEVFACDRFKNNFSMDDVDMYLNEAEDYNSNKIVFGHNADSFNSLNASFDFLF